MNYFNYFTEIEDAFVRRRGKHLLLSPLDWALIESWKETGVPLHVALRGIERAFDSWEARPRKRTVKSLLYCQEEVEAQYAEWNEARVGHTSEGEGAAESRVEKEQSPFSRDSILEHLSVAKAALLSTLEQRRRDGEDSFSEVLERSSRLLGELIEDFCESQAPDTRRLEDSLSGLERMLSDALKTTVSQEQLESFQAEIVEQLRPYRAHMNKAVFQQTLDNLLLKRLREQFAVPRLSLFYL